MTLDEFRNELLETVRARAESNMDFNRASFIDEVSERLSDAEEFCDFEICRYEGLGNRTKLKIDGYAFDDADNSLAILIADYSNDGDMPKFNISDANKMFGMLRAFMEEALKGNLTDGSIEESQPAYGFACDLMDWHTKISKYRFYIASDAQLKTRSKDWQQESLNGTPTEFHIWDISRFYTAHISATGRDVLVVDFKGTGDGLPFLAAGKEIGADYQAYLCMISGVTLAEIYERYGSRLLEGNVRTFLSTKGKVNTKIQETIRSKPEMFFAYNNGIAATAEDIIVEDTALGMRIVSATNLQIVNGGQTTASLALASKSNGPNKNAADLSKIMVQMKLSVLPPEKAGELIPDIARFANSQNKVSDADFFSNHPYHIRMEEFSRRLFTPPALGVQHGTHWFYERARGQYINEQANLTPAQKRQFLLQNPRSQLLTKTDIAKLENTWKELPHKVSLGAQKNFNIFSELITKNWLKDNVKFNEEYFKNISAIAMLFKRTESIVTNQKWYQGGYRANIVTYSLAKLHNLVSEDALGKQIDLKLIWDKQVIPDEVVEQITIITKVVFDVLTDPNRQKDNVTEWAKMQLCWEKLKAYKINLTEGMIENLQDIKIVDESGKNAEVSQKIDGGIAVQLLVFDIPASEWERILAWGNSLDLLTLKQVNLLKVAIKMPKQIPTEKQCGQIWSIYNELLHQGYSKNSSLVV